MRANTSVGIIHRSSTRTPAPPAPGGGGGGAPVQAQLCGHTMAALPPGGTPGGITHDFQTEGYLIISGGGPMFTDGYIVNGRHNDQDPQGGPNGPSCGGMAYDVEESYSKGRRRGDRRTGRGARVGRHPRPRGLFELPAIAERAAGWQGESDDREVMLSTLCFAPREDCAGRRLTLSGEG